MENKPENNKPEEKKSNNRLLLILLILLLLSNGAFVYLWLQEKGRANTEVVIKEQVIVERDNLKTDLLKLKDDYSTLQTNDLALQKELDEKRSQIEELLVEAEKHKNDGYIIAKLKKETETLRKIMKHYVVQIDSLNTLNKTLIVEKGQVQASLDEEKTKTSKLAEDKENLQKTVNIGARLKATSPTVKGIKFKSDGKKEVETDRASKVERIKVMFTLGENPIAKKEMKPVFIRIVSPEGKEITKSMEEGNIVKFNGSRGYFAARQDVNYKNEDVAVSVMCPSPNGFVPGKYMIDIIVDEAIVGQTSITLK